MSLLSTGGLALRRFGLYVLDLRRKDSGHVRRSILFVSRCSSDGRWHGLLRFGLQAPIEIRRRRQRQVGIW